MRLRDMMADRIALLSGLVSALALAGCAGDAARYPSLALREVEKRPFYTVPDAPPAAATAPQPADTAGIAALRQNAESAFAAFAQKQPAVSALVAQARGQRSDSAARARALAALADLTAQRSATFVPLGELDRIAAETAAQYGETAPITAAQAAVLALVERQDASLDALWGELGQ